MSWLVGIVETNKERSCHMDLQRNGTETYIPLGSRYTKPKRKRTVVRAVYFPFPGYIFINEETVTECKTARGFLGWIKTSEGFLLRVSEGVVDAMKNMQLSGDFDLGVGNRAEKEFCKDDFVKITNGPFIGMNGIVAADTMGKSWVEVLLANMRIKILVDFVIKN